MKKYLLLTIMALSLGAVADPASARRVHVVVRQAFVAENFIVEEYPEYYVSHRVHRQPRHRCHHCHSHPRAHRPVRYYYTPDYYDYYQPEVVVYQQEYHWYW
jgi:hypothetical protein